MIGYGIGSYSVAEQTFEPPKSTVVSGKEDDDRCR